MLGFERSFHGRPAGIRTHALVCLASALLMLVPAYQATWLGIPPETEAAVVRPRTWG
ncbi:MAG: MgtC/SapB family protein [Methyloceanibacter sp.]